MSNDVTIEIRSDTGDTIMKLAATKAAVEDLGKATDTTTAKIDKNTQSTNRLGGALGFLTSNWKVLLPVVASAGVGLLGVTGSFGALVPMVPVLTVALAGLIAPFTTLAAIAIAFVPPLTLIAGLLGVLGLGFVLAGQRAAKGGGALSQFSQELAKLTSMFHKTADILAHDFLPYFMQLAHAGEIALLYFDKLAKLNLGAAMRSLSTTGVEMLTHFLDAIGHVIGKPIRLAFEIAFGPQGTQIRNSMLKIWTQIQAFFMKPPSTGGPSIASMVGKWWGRQDFTGLGMRWATEIAGALMAALPMAIKHALGSRGGMLIGGGALAGGGIGLALGGPIGAAVGAAMGVSIGTVLNHYWPTIVKGAEAAWKAVVSTFHAVTTAISHVIGPATWHNLARIAVDTWSIIKTVGMATFHLVFGAAKEIWRIFDTLVIKTGLWKVILGAVILVFDAVVGVVRLVMDGIRWLVTNITHFSGIVGGALLSAFNAVLGVVGSIVGGITSAIGAAASLASVLGSANPNAAAAAAGGSSGGRYGINSPPPGTRRPSAVVQHFHFPNAHLVDPHTVAIVSRQVGAAAARGARRGV